MLGTQKKRPAFGPAQVARREGTAQERPSLADRLARGDEGKGKSPSVPSGALSNSTTVPRGLQLATVVVNGALKRRRREGRLEDRPKFMTSKSGVEVGSTTTPPTRAEANEKEGPALGPALVLKKGFQWGRVICNDPTTDCRRAPCGGTGTEPTPPLTARRRRPTRRLRVAAAPRGQAASSCRRPRPSTPRA